MNDDAVPERLGAYRLEASLGRGGMGEVFLAWDERLERHVAIKRVLTDPPPSERARARFRREAKAAARLSHPAIVQVFDLLEIESGDCLVMEYVEGRGLPEVIAAGDLDLDTALRLGAEIAEGLGEAHARGLVHRDLKTDNVQVTRSGHAKILDFGLAGLLWADEADGDTRAATITRTPGVDPGDALTRTGAILGTVHAMSPEQASGQPVDHRSDLFALGGLLYEMLTGQAPFRGANVLDTLRRVTGEDPAPLAELRPDLPPALVELIGGLLAKDPAHRPQNARLVADTLDRLRAETATYPAPESAGHPALGAPPAHPPPAGPAPPAGAESGDQPTGQWPAPAISRRPKIGKALAGLAAILVTAALAAGVLRWTAQPTPEPAPLGQTGKQSLAVLLFQNLRTDPELAWLSHGISEMLITDLSQSPEIDVLGLDRLGLILDRLDAAGGESSAGNLRELTEAGIDTVLQGSFARSGDVLRIYFKIQQTATGEIVISDRREGHFETGLFSIVDDLSRTIRSRLEVPRRAELAASVAAVTTSSLEAWRLFAEGLELHRQSKDREALPLLEQAVAVDPEFALALANLSVFNENLGHAGRAREYGRRAVEHADRLPIRQRYFVEGWYFNGRWQTYGKAVRAYREGLEIYPDNKTFRGNLAQLYLYLERYQDAIREYDRLIAQGDEYGPTFYALASAQAATGDYETGGGLLSEYVRRAPEGWFGQLALGWHLTNQGRLDEALEALHRAAELRPGEIFVGQTRWRNQILRQNWEQAASEADAMAAATDSFARWRGLVCAARTRLYRGRSEEALDLLEASARAYDEPEAYTALSHCWRARLLLQMGLPARALDSARQAQLEAPGDWPELEGLFLAALAHQSLGRPAEADRLLADLTERAASFPNAVEERQIRHLAGRLALARGDPARATSELERAAALLPERGAPFHTHALPDHVPLWHALGEAELAAGRPRAALSWFQRVAESGAEHIEHPVPYARSLFRLGEIQTSLEHRGQAQAAYRRFLELWRHGDLDSREISLAERESRSLGSQPALGEAP